MKRQFVSGKKEVDKSKPIRMTLSELSDDEISLEDIDNRIIKLYDMGEKEAEGEEE